MSGADDLFSVMTVHALDVSTETAEHVALDRWGIAARARALTGERDRNFRLTADDGREFVLKFANPAEDAGVTHMQIAALHHIARTDPTLPVPRVIALPDGAVETLVTHETGAIQRVRLLSWLPGTNLVRSRRSIAQCEGCGTLLARVQLALADFAHPAADHALVWDLKQTLRMREVMFALTDTAARDQVNAVFDAFESRVTPALPHLRRQIVHNDMNGLNTLVDDTDRIAALIDFGDTVNTAIIIDVATAGPTQSVPGLPRAETLACFVGAFHRIRPLLPEEIALLPLLCASRVAISLVLQSWHRHVQPDNPHYTTMTPDDIAARLAVMAELMAPGTAAQVRQATR